MKGTMEAAKTAVMAVEEADNQVNNARPIHTTTRSSGPALRKSTFNWKASNKYPER